MTNEEFSRVRQRLDKTQKQMAELLGTSLKAVHSYEQGWRQIPPHVERQIFFLLARHRDFATAALKNCWTIKKCPAAIKRKCPAWEFQAGKLCWFINGTLCECNAQKNWREKMKICRKCEVLAPLLLP